MRCDQCRYWKPDTGEDWEAKDLGFGECDKAVMLDRIWDFDYSSGTATKVLLPEHRDLKMTVMDGSSYKAVLYTKPDFFCAHFEEKKSGVDYRRPANEGTRCDIYAPGGPILCQWPDCDCKRKGE